MIDGTYYIYNMRVAEYLVDTIIMAYVDEQRLSPEKIAEIMQNTQQIWTVDIWTLFVLFLCMMIVDKSSEKWSKRVNIFGFVKQQKGCTFCCFSIIFLYLVIIGSFGLKFKERCNI